MTLLLALAGIALLGTGLAAGAAVRALRRRDHRCAERSRPDSCDRCAAVLRGEDRGGHMVCACGAASPHLSGTDLLHWRAAHHGESLPPLPGEPVDDAQAAGEGQAAGGAHAAPVRSTTRRGAAGEAEERARHALVEELRETQRRMIERARRRPDPITPQLLREAEELGVRAEPAPERDPAPAPASDVSPASDGTTEAPPR